jgi:hypothetical protein
MALRPSVDTRACPRIMSFRAGRQRFGGVGGHPQERWDAGGVLMQVARPADWRELAVNRTLAWTSADEPKAKREMPAKARREQPSVITVTAPRW